VLRSLRGSDGGPSLQARLLALVVAVAALIVAAPVALVPLLRAVFTALP